MNVLPTKTRVAALAAVAAIGLAACSSPDPSSTAPEPAPTTSAQASTDEKVNNGAAASKTKPTTAGVDSDVGKPQLAADSFVPSVQVLDVGTNETVDMQSIVPSDKPVLLWAWAPHCTSCRAEASGLEEFAATHKDKITVVGVGSQDDEGYAHEFIEDTGVQTPRMLWDPTFDSWRVMGITATPTWVLVNGDGSFNDGWIGPLPEDEILELIQS
jgi:thiol-disulfide isomerase/thioredoxin